MLDDSRDKHCMFSSSMKPFDLSEATKLSLVLSASQHINQQQLKDSFMKNFGRYSTSDFEDTDSRFSFSSSSSPVHVSFFEIKFLLRKTLKLKLHVLEWKQRSRLNRHDIRILRQRWRRHSQVIGNKSFGSTSYLIVRWSHYRCCKPSFSYESNLLRHHFEH